MRAARQNESAEHSPYLRIRVGRVTAVHYKKGGEGTPSESSKPLDGVLGRIQIAWADGQGTRDMVPLTFSSFSNPVVSGGDPTDPISRISARCYGDITLPSVGDLVAIGFRAPESPVMLGYISANYFQQTSGDLSKPAIWGTMRAIEPGEMSRLSGPQAEIYQDKGGAVQIIVKAQPTGPASLGDGSDADSADEIDPMTVPTEELARVTVGEAYTDETFSVRDVGASGKKLIFRLTTKSGALVKIDTEGNVEVSAAPGKSYAINSGTKGVSRLGDATKSTSSEDQQFWGFFAAFVQAFQTWSPVPLDGGAALKTALTPVFAQFPQVPSSLTAKITTASQNVKAGD